MQNVAPYVGAWIETPRRRCQPECSESHPTWVRGLKLNYVALAISRTVVAPYVGAWIETILR